MDNTLAASLIPKMTGYIPHAPRPKQQAFMLLDCEEAFYGGAGGGGKSDALLMCALQYADVPGYSALILRRTYKDLSLPNAIMDRARQWLSGTDAVWREDDKRWTFPSGANLTFGYLEHEADKYQYQGAELQFIAFDELTQFSESQYTYLFSRLRRLVGLPVPTRMRAASNPGGIGHEWVKARFIDPGSPGSPFIPASISDNPFIDEVEYRKSLSHLDPLDRAQIERGDWTAKPEGGKFRREWFPVIPAVPTLTRQIRYWDLASTKPNKENTDPDYTVGCRMGWDGNAFIITNVARWRDTPAKVEAMMRNIGSQDGRQIPIRLEQEPGSSGVIVVDHYARNVFKGFNFSGVRATGNKTGRANPLSSWAEQGKVLLVEGDWNEAFLNELETFPQKGFHDDQVDAASGAMAELANVYDIDLNAYAALEYDATRYMEQERRGPKNLREYRERNARGNMGGLSQVRRI